MGISTRISFQVLLSNILLCFIDYHFKACMVKQKCKNNISGSTSRIRPPKTGGSSAFRVREKE
jgi:hypothetical protein